MPHHHHSRDHGTLDKLCLISLFLRSLTFLVSDLVKPLSRLLLTFLACSAPVSAWGQSTSPSDRAPPAAAADPVLNPGDELKITVWRRPELSGEFEIAPDGSIAHPLYREVKVAGISLSAAEERVRTFLGQHESNAAFIMAPLFRVIVGGEVQKPGLYNVPPVTTITQVLALAGGPTERGRLDELRIARERQVLTIDLNRPDSDLFIHSGDRIIVPRRHKGFLEIVGPVSSVVGAAAALVSIVVQLNRR
jgi:protein involved in polysaccharide export with SLBB domain